MKSTHTKRALLLASAASLLLAACGQQQEPAPKPAGPAGGGGKARTVATRAVTVIELDLTPRLVVDGEVVNLYSPDVAAEIAGKVLAVHVEPGQSVRRGDLLVSLDTSDVALSAAADRAEQARLAALAADKAAAFERLRILGEQDLVSRASVQTAERDAAAAREAVKAAEARASLSARNVAKAQVRAPFDAEVVERRAVPGAYVRAGDILVSLVQPKVSHIRVMVPESSVSQVKAGMAADAQVAGAEEFKSMVTAVRQYTNRTSRMVEATVAVPKGMALRPGSSARVELRLGDVRGLVVPEVSVVTEGAKAFVFSIAGGTVTRVPVELGTRRAGLVEVRSGLAAGTQVARDPAFLTDGTKVSVVAEDAAK